MYMQGNRANNSFVIPAKAGTQNLNKKCRSAKFSVRTGFWPALG